MKKTSNVICLILIVISIIFTLYNLLSKPTMMRGKPASMAPSASVFRVETGSIPIYIETVATLIPFQSITLKSKVAGTVEYLSDEFETGAIITKNTTLLSLQKRDYENAVRKLEATLAKTKADYDVELGYQKIVQEELKQLEGIMATSAARDELHTELTLRKPQLNQVLSDLAIAEANLLDAKYDLEETEIKAPFDALILTRAVSIGQHISANETLAELVSVSKYLADVAIPIDALYNNDLLTYKNKEVPIEVITNYGEKWEGKLEQIVSALTTDSRMGKVIVSVEDPLALLENNNKVPLLLGDQVNIRILAGSYDDVIKLPRSAVFNNENIWLVNSENILKYKKIDIVWSDGDNVYVKGSQLPNNSLVLHSGINNPVENLAIKPTIINLTEEEKAEEERLYQERLSEKQLSQDGGMKSMQANPQVNEGMPRGDGAARGEAVGSGEGRRRQRPENANSQRQNKQSPMNEE